MTEIYDLAILGAGPAGISAAVYAARARLKTLWLEKKFTQGGQIVNTYEVDNYPGLPGMNGMELGEAMAAHAEKLGAVPMRETVVSVEDEGSLKVIRTKKNEYRARTVIFAFGAEHRQLGIPGEQELSGMGVSYCATCDGAFFKDGTVAVVGGGNTAVEDAVFLSRICRKVYVVHRRNQLRADKILQERLFACGNVEILWDTVPVSIEGTEETEALKVRGTKTETETLLPVDGVFIAVGVVPNTQKLKGLVKLDENGYVAAGEDGITSVPGFFAAGDIRAKNLRQVVTAVSDGANAVASVQRYLMEA
ncbi:MAG TPA: thioredoxin-disulfide reductase [Candidatus Blautia faecipullorum]|nr:thioredoxin-disulfide reductase [Candidatus Blautia faecipullorum]